MRLESESGHSVAAKRPRRARAAAARVRSPLGIARAKDGGEMNPAPARSKRPPALEDTSHAGGGPATARHLPHPAALLRSTPSGGGPRHPNDPGLPRPGRWAHRHDLHPRPEAGSQGHPKPPGSETMRGQARPRPAPCPHPDGPSRPSSPYPANPRSRSAARERGPPASSPGAGTSHRTGSQQKLLRRETCRDARLRSQGN